MHNVNFSIEPLDKVDKYYGFSLEGSPLHLSPKGVVLHNSGKSVMEQSIVGHVSRYPERFQLVGVDCKRVEFNLLRGVMGVKGVALDVPTAAATVANFQRLMMARFKFMEKMKVNNIYDIHDQEVNYYEVFGQTVQFDEMFELTIDMDEKDRNFEKLKGGYPFDEKLGTYRQPVILTIEEIYNGMMDNTWVDEAQGLNRHPQLPEYKGYNPFITKDSIRKKKGIFTPKALIFLADELNELMTSDDYKSVDTVKGALGSIARLGRAAGVHLALACQRASGSTISSDLKNNIQMSILLGDFDDGASVLMFEKDISALAKPYIKGRGFIGSGQEIIETQTYYTQPKKDWKFDENQKLSYENPVFEEQCKILGKDFDKLNTGWWNEDEKPTEEKPEDEKPVEDVNGEPENIDDEDDEDIIEENASEAVVTPPVTEPQRKESPLVFDNSVVDDVPVPPMTNREKVENELGKIEPAPVKIKLNVDKTAEERPKTKIKLNLPPKSPNPPAPPMV